jgi:hypothetical protein
MKTLELKWKHAYLILFPEVPKDQVPSPFRSKYFGQNLPLHAHHHCSGCSCKQEKSTQQPVDFSSFIAMAQNGLYDSLSGDGRLSCSMKMDILLSFNEFCNKIGGDPTGEANYNTSTIDWKSLSQRGVTPEFEFANEQPTVKTTEDLGLEFRSSDSEVLMEEISFHGLPNTPTLSASQPSQILYNYGGYPTSQASAGGLGMSLYGEDAGYLDSMFPELATHTSNDFKQLYDYGSQTLTPPITPDELDCSLDAKPAIASSYEHNDTISKTETMMTPEMGSQSCDSALDGLDFTFCAGNTTDWQLYDMYTNIDDLAPAVWPGDI